MPILEETGLVSAFLLRTPPRLLTGAFLRLRDHGSARGPSRPVPEIDPSSTTNAEHGDNKTSRRHDRRAGVNGHRLVRVVAKSSARSDVARRRTLVAQGVGHQAAENCRRLPAARRRVPVSRELHSPRGMEPPKQRRTQSATRVSAADVSVTRGNRPSPWALACGAKRLHLNSVGWFVYQGGPGFNPLVDSGCGHGPAAPLEVRIPRSQRGFCAARSP
jgi:hypothetical protein